MKANDAYLMTFLGQNNVCFEIPVYQRSYDWGEEHCKQLLEDICDCLDKGLKSYFVGSIVHIQEKGPVSVTGLNNIVIIDGQQRITTVSLILLAIATVLKNDKSSVPIINNYLLNPLQEDAAKVKLKPVKGDYQAFLDIISGKKPSISNSVGRNYKYIKDSFETSTFDPKKVLEGLGRLKIVEVSLEVGQDNPQLIFESLNSTGLGLSHSDLVRNFILMTLSYNQQRTFYEKYWVEIERNCGHKTAEFIRDFLVIKLKSIPPKNAAYKAFKIYAMGNDVSETEDLLKSLLHYSKLFSYIWYEDHPSRRIRQALVGFRELGVKAITPYLIPLLEDFETGSIAEDIVVAAVDLCESFVIRRSICELPSSSLVKAFASLHREVKRVNEDWSSNYINYLHYVLGRKVNKGRFPKTYEVEQALLERDFYQFNHTIRNYIFESLENKNKKEKTTIQKGIVDGDLSIEHIMPQTLSKAWKDELGARSKEIHERYLNILGNLSITGFNSKISNKGFKEKLEQAFKDSPFWLNNYVGKQETWGEREILERSKILSERVISIWPDLDRGLEYRTDEHEEHVLADPLDIKYTNPVSIEISGKSYETPTYREVMAEFLKHVYSIDPTKLFSLQKAERFSKCIITEDPSELKVPYKISDGLFTEGWASATSLVKNIMRIAPHFGIDLENIVIKTMKERRPKFRMNKSA